MAVFSGPEIVNSGLVLHLDAANSKSYPGSGTIWRDLSGNENNGVLVNGSVFSGSNLGTLTFDGINDYVTVNHNASLSLSTNLTITIVFKFNSLSGFQTFVHNKNGIWSNNVGFYCEWRPSTQSFMFIGSGTTFVDSATVQGVTTTSPRSVTFTINNTSVLIYHNSVLIGQGNLGNNVASTTNTYYLNAFFNNASFFNGTTYQLSLYNRTLSSTEIQQNFEATRSRYGI